MGEHLSSEPEAEEERHEKHDDPLLGRERCILITPAATRAFAFNAGRRPWRDTLFSGLFAVALLTTYGVGFVAVRNAEPQPESKLRFMRYNPESNQCERIHHAYVGTTPTHVALIPERRAYETGPHRPEPNFAAVLAPVAATAALILPVGLALLYLLHRHTRAFLFAILALMCIVPASFAVVASSVCLTSRRCSAMPTSSRITSGALSVAAVVAFFQFLVVCNNRSRLDLTVQILRTSVQALKQNLSLLLLNPVLGVATVVINAPIAVFAWCALLNGRVAPDFEAIRDVANGCGQSTGAPCCRFQQPEWVTPYLTLAGVAALWVVLVAGQLQILVVSGTVSQWYFAPAGWSSTAGTTKRAIRNALGPSFGTACLASLMLTIATLFKGVADRTAVKSGPGIVTVFLRACLAWLCKLLEVFTGFTTNVAAITGDGFCDAAHATGELVRRNWLSTLVVEVLVRYLLTGMALTVALLHFFAVWGAMQHFTAAGPLWSLATANACLLVALLGLAQVCQAVAAATDTVYICYSMDKEAGVVSKAEVHDVYSLPPASSPADETMLAVRSFES